MDEKKLLRMWAISLIIIGVANVVVSVVRIFCDSVPDVLAVVCGALILISVPFLFYSTLRLYVFRKK